MVPALVLPESRKFADSAGLIRLILSTKELRGRRDPSVRRITGNTCAQRLNHKVVHVGNVGNTLGIQTVMTAPVIAAAGE